MVAFIWPVSFFSLFLLPSGSFVRSFVRSFLARSFACTLVLHSSAFWELAPYIPGATAANVEAQCKPFMIENAGKAFEFMTDSCNEERKAAGLPPIAEARGNATGGAIDAALAAVVDGHRAKFGLPPLAEANAGATSGEGSEEAFLQLQKDETVAALGKWWDACRGGDEVAERNLEMANSFYKNPGGVVLAQVPFKRHKFPKKIPERREWRRLSHIEVAI